MRYGSICSGIEAASVAFRPLGWHAAFFAEIEPFCCAVLQHHYPTVPNLGDFTHITKEAVLGAIDLLIGGTPCQSFSLAGRREGLADPRGHLTLEYFALIDRLRPRWCIWENVPGVLSDDGGQTFKQVLQILEEMRYSVECDILDAQFHGVPQRRRRVFLVCHDVSGPPQTTPYYAHIGLQALGESLLGCWDEVARLSTIVPIGSDSPKALSADGRQRRMRLFGITTFSAFETWLGCLVEGSQKRPREPISSGCLSSGDMDTNLIETAMSTFPIEILTELYGARWNTDWSWNEFWGDDSSVASAFIISTSTNRTINQIICSCALALLSIAPYTLALMRSFPNLYTEASWLLTALERLTSYARSATSQLFTDAVGGADFWRCVEQCATDYYQQALGYLRDDSRREVSAQPTSLSGHPAPRRETRESVAARTAPGVDRERAEDAITYAGYRVSPNSGAWETGERVDSLTTQTDKGSFLVAAYGGNHTAGPIDIATACNAHGGTGRLDFESETFIVAQNGSDVQINAIPGAISAGQSRQTSGDLVAMAVTERTRKDGRHCETLAETSYALCNPGSGGRAQSRQVLAPCLTQNYGKQPDNSDTGEVPMLVYEGMMARRLTPLECERLQGLHDNWTLVPYRGTLAKDAPRYRAIGNSFAVPVVRWIGRRIQQVEEVLSG